MSCTEIVVTVISILLSGAFSWIASWVYYKKSNRNNALSHVIAQVFALTVAEAPFKKNTDAFRSVIMQHDLKYLKKDERELIEYLFFLYLEVSAYTDDEVYALVLRDKAYRVIEKNNIETEIEPYFDADGELQIFLEPAEYRRLHKYILEFLVNNHIFLYYLDDDNKTEYQHKINYYLNFLLNETLGCKDKIDFFEDESLMETINNSELLKNHNESKDKYFDSVEKFQKVFEKEINPLWNELFLENEGVSF